MSQHEILRTTYLLREKEKDKMWYITKEEFDAYKAGDVTVIQRMHKVTIRN